MRYYSYCTDMPIYTDREINGYMHTELFYELIIKADVENDVSIHSIISSLHRSLYGD